MSDQSKLAAALADRYRIERELGQGGMATVYLAQDLKHDRKVALKVLRPELAAVIGADRFLQEIKTTANLQHPHILPLFDSGHVDGTVFYVMPFVQGESLRERLSRDKQLPVEDALRITRDVGSALDYAHRHGVIHRDIKPENILLHDTQALVADFGIALAASRSEGGSRMTETGMSLGTPHYMSPEQAMGERNLDARTDVYALGCVLYEMLIGEPPFTGPTAQAILARVMTETPRSVTLQRKAVPPHVEAAVFTALEKIPADRFATATEFLAALGDSTRRLALTAEPGRATPGPLRRALPWALAVVGLGLAGIGMFRGRAGVLPRPVRFAIGPGTDEQILPGDGVSLSADGRTLVYVVSRGGVARLVRRSLDQVESHVLEGTEGALEPALSPDGHWLAFATSDGRIKKLSLDGGTPVTLATGNAPAGMTWTRNSGLVLGMLRFSPMNGLSLLADAGDTSVHRLTTPVNGMHHMPVPLSDGATLLFQDIQFGKGTALGVASISDGKFERLDLQVSQPIGVVNGILLYVGTDQHMRAVTFDAKRRRVSGAPITLGEGQIDRASLAADGTLAMTVESAALELVLVDEKGMSRTLLPDHLTAAIVRYSPDGRRVALSGDLRGTESVWVLDLTTGALVKLGLRPGVALDWSRDSRRVLGFDEERRVVWQAADAGDTVAALGGASIPKARTLSLAPDQRALAVGVGSAGGEFDIVTTRAGDTTVVPFAASKANEALPQFSPDGRYLVYVSDESGRYEVYARPYPGPGPRVQLSDDGGTEPIWARDGRRVFYRAGRAMMVAHLLPGPTLAVARHERLFEGDFWNSSVFGIPALSYDVAPDGHHFVMTRAVGGAGPEVVVWTNWLPELKARMDRERP